MMSMEQREPMDDQSEVVAFLSSPCAYPGTLPAVEQLATHGALVFLAGSDAYKIKRAVRYDYMDFSTLARRRAAIAREFEVNQPHAPQIYLGIVAVTREADGSLKLGGSGMPVEWAVHMRRFDQQDLMSSIADRGALSRDLARSLADAVLDSHRRAPHCIDADADRRMERITDDLASGLAPLDAVLSPFDHHAFAAAAARQLERARSLLRARGTAGLVARCHGDLHLNNIVLWNGVPTLFDAIEFDENLATIDTYYDLAFLLMDLDHRRHRQAANIVLNRYLTRSPLALDLDGLVAMPLFLGLRSAVRGLVAGQRGLLQSDASAGRAADFAAARSNLEDAVRYLTPPPPRLVAVGGLSGTGKTSVAAALAPALDPAPGAVHIRSDVERKSMFGVPETERLPADSYTPESSAAVYRRVLEKAATVVAAGHSAIVDAVFSTAAERSAVEAVARAAGVAFDGIWLEAPREAMLARVAGRRGDASDATAAVVELQLARGSADVGWNRVDSGGSLQSAIEAATRIICPTSD